MWCLKRCGKRQAHRFLVRSHDIQVRHWKFAVYSCDEPLLVLKKHPEVNAADTITVRKHKYYSIVLLCSGIVDVVNVIDHRWKGMRVCEHVGSDSATGVPNVLVQTRQRHRWGGESRVSWPHLLHPWANLYHRRSRSHSPPSKMWLSSSSSSSKITGR